MLKKRRLRALRAASDAAERRSWALLAEINEMVREGQRIERIENLRRAPVLDFLLTLDPGAFEVTVADVLSATITGPLEVIGGAGDNGADLLGRDLNTGQITIVQCKRYGPGRPIGAPELQRLLGAQVIHRAERAIFVTTSTFTSAARRIAVDHSVRLVDGMALVDLAVTANAKTQ